jgi:hypothetical protein
MNGKTRRWVAAAVTVLALTGCTINTGGSGEDTGKEVGTTVGEGTNAAAIAALLDMTWDQMSANDKDMMCTGWNAGMQDTLVDAFFSDWDTTSQPFTRSEVEPELIAMMDEKC